MPLRLILLAVLALTACKDRYRYPCQNPENFAAAECQKPICLFTQQCPEYLVAPVLEKQLVQPVQQQQPAEATPNR